MTVEKKSPIRSGQERRTTFRAEHNSPFPPLYNISSSTQLPFSFLCTTFLAQHNSPFPFFTQHFQLNTAPLFLSLYKISSSTQLPSLFIQHFALKAASLPPLLQYFELKLASLPPYTTFRAQNSSLSPFYTTFRAQHSSHFPPLFKKKKKLLQGQ